MSTSDHTGGMERKPAAALKLTEDEKEQFRRAIEFFGLPNGPAFLLMCFRALNYHAQEKHDLMIPLQFVRAKPIQNGHPQRPIDDEEAQ
jgi:hypothetical protein